MMWWNIFSLRTSKEGVNKDNDDKIEGVDENYNFQGVNVNQAALARHLLSPPSPSGQQVHSSNLFQYEFFFGQPETKLFNEIEFNSPQQQQQPRQDTYNDIRPDILEMIKVTISKNLGRLWRSRWWDVMIIDHGIIMIVMFKMVGFDDHWLWHDHYCDGYQEEQKAKLMEPNKHWGQPPVPNVQGDGYNYQVS